MKAYSRCIIGISTLLSVLGCGPPTPEIPPVDEAYLAELEEWHRERSERLGSETGWLTVVGLHWLKEGENRFGTDPVNEVVLPEAAKVSYGGSLFLEGGEITVRPSEGTDLRLRGEPVVETKIESDEHGPPEVLTLGGVSFHVLSRGGRYAVRVKDPGCEARRSFRGVERFPVDPRFQVEAIFVPYETPRETAFPTVIGTDAQFLVPGIVQFELDGVASTLEPVIADPSVALLFFVFGDQTNGDTTYGAGRFLYTDREKDGRVTLDFNRAINPPCAFTEFATCPLPPPQNRLPLRVEAGEKKYGKH
jgi:uncharacterized protein (DUF1684 family)